MDRCVCVWGGVISKGTVRMQRKKEMKKKKIDIRRSALALSLIHHSI